jgi:hypothetical protein
MVETNNYPSDSSTIQFHAPLIDQATDPVVIGIGFGLANEPHPLLDCCRVAKYALLWHGFNS